MAIIGSIRKHSGLVVTIVGVAIAAFVIGDLGKGSPRKDYIVGVVDGEEITYREFEEKVEENSELSKMNSGKTSLTSDEIFDIRQNTWQMFVNEIIMDKQYEELGLTISEEELNDLIQGENPHRFIVQNFTDPNTGQFNRDLLLNFLQTLDQREARVQMQMENILQVVKADALNTKFNDLITKGYYMPAAFAQMDYDRKNRSVDFRMLAVPYSTIADSTIKLTDADFQDFYNEHKDRYEQKRNVDIEYVTFDIRPSADDKEFTRKTVIELYDELKGLKLADVPRFIGYNSDAPYDSTWKTKGSLPIQIDSLMFHNEAGYTAKPYLDNNIYHVARLMDVAMRPDSMKASHILISYQGAFRAATDAMAREKAVELADSLKNVLENNPQKMEELAKQYSTDPSAAENGGDLDWFADGSMVGPFNEAVLEARVGDIVTVETAFGFHVIKVTGKKEDVKKVRVAMFDREIIPSNQTIQKIYSDASSFAGEHRTIDAFNTAITENGLNKRQREYLNPMDNRIPGVESPRQMIRWAFNEETNVGDVSQVFENDDKFIVAALKERREDGIAPLSQIRDVIEPLVLKKKKADLIIEKMKQSNAKSLEEYAQKFDQEIDSVKNIKFPSFNLPKIGREMEVIGEVLGSPKGQLVGPIEGNNAAFVVVVDKFVEPVLKDNFGSEQKQMVNSLRARANNYIFRALEESANIEDNRVDYY